MEEKDLYEHWRPVAGAENYEVSNKGNVRNIRTGRILKPRLNMPNGYQRVALNGKDEYVHRLVANAFLDKDLVRTEVRHKDDDRTNNDLSNLEWQSRRRDLQDPDTDARTVGRRSRVVTCRDCPYRYEYEICLDKPDDFYCAYGQNE